MRDARSFLVLEGKNYHRLVACGGSLYSCGISIGSSINIASSQRYLAEGFSCIGVGKYKALACRGVLHHDGAYRRTLSSIRMGSVSIETG